VKLVHGVLCRTANGKYMLERIECCKKQWATSAQKKQQTLPTRAKESAGLPVITGMPVKKGFT
jgi:hypothetical protein